MSRVDTAERLEAWLERRWRWMMVLVLAAGLLLAWSLRFVQDDAFISFVYARDLVEHRQLTWFGTPVEGYTNFLWVLWIALGMRLDMEPVLWSQIGGLAAFAFLLAGLSELARRILGSRRAALLALALLMVNYSVLRFATGGLETMLQTALLCWIALLHLRDPDHARPGHRDALLLSVLAALAILTRPDSALPVAVIGLFHLAGLARRRARPGAFAALLLPGALLLGAWGAWKLHYYGHLLPNPFHAKVAPDLESLRAGVLLVARFLHAYLLWPILAGGALTWLFRKHPIHLLWRPILTILVTWFLYLLYAGGDFMEYRFLIPVSPFLMLLVAAAVQRLDQEIVRRPSWAVALALAMTLAASWHHGATFRGMSSDRLTDSIDALSTFHGIYPHGDWSVLGKRLREDLGDESVVLASRAAGAIPFYSGLETVDQWGLNDPWIPHHGIPAPPEQRRPGHRRHASLDYLRRRGVHLVLGHPTLVVRGCLGNPAAHDFLVSWVTGDCLVSNDDPGSHARLVTIPVTPRAALLAWYLTPCNAVERALAERGWTQARLDLSTDLPPG